MADQGKQYWTYSLIKERLRRKEVGTD